MTIDTNDRVKIERELGGKDRNGPITRYYRNTKHGEANSEVVQAFHHNADKKWVKDLLHNRGLKKKMTQSTARQMEREK